MPRARYRIRRARRSDATSYLALVEELARFERLQPPTPAARRRLRKDAFGVRPKYELYVATTGRPAKVVAYAVVVWTYSSFLGKPTLYLEDIYLQPTHRGTGLAQAFLRFLSRRALKEKAGRLEGVVLAWNRRARRFYARTKAQEMRDWIFFRYDEFALRRLAR